MAASSKSEILLAERPRDELEGMAAAGREIIECYRVLEKTDSNVVAEVIRHHGTFYEWDHYPPGDAVDWETYSQYYYHAHGDDERPGEHGHFHTFLRFENMPKGLKPLDLEFAQASNGDRIGAHLVGISMDGPGFPTGLFTVNRWVTDETWYGACDVTRMLDLFKMDHTHPSWAVNRWLSAVLILFRPHIEQLLMDRDAKVEAWMEAHPGIDVFEDRELEVTSHISISVPEQIKAVAQTLKGR